MPISTERIAAFLAADGRERKKLLKEILPDATSAEDARALAPALRDPSPRVAARVTALLARHGLAEVLEAQLRGLKPGKINLLRGQFRRIADDASGLGSTPAAPPKSVAADPAASDAASKDAASKDAASGAEDPTDIPPSA